MKKYIIYEITNKINGKKYIGCHITENINDNYMGSGKYLKKAIKKYGIDNFNKIILYFCENEEEMLKKEREIVNEDIINSNSYYNLSLGGNSWFHINNNPDINSVNRIVLRNKITNEIIKINKDDIRCKDDNFESLMKNKAYYKDKDGNIYKVNINDERIESGELTSVHKGLILAVDKNDKCLIVSKDDKRLESGDIKYYWTGKKQSEQTKKKIGEKNSILQKGEKNSQYNTCWIINNTDKKCIKINNSLLNEYLQKGWTKGRKMNW